jgi:hypothetical protein
MHGIKIKMVKIDGKDRVPPECMRILIDLAGHRDVCYECSAAFRNQTANWCPTGIALLQELAQQPEVEPLT